MEIKGLGERDWSIQECDVIISCMQHSLTYEICSQVI